MKLGLLLYQMGSTALSAVLRPLLARRVRRGKENSKRLNERLAKRLPPRPSGDLVWLHAASVGESLIQIEIAEKLFARDLAKQFLFTCQTLTGADTINHAVASSEALSQAWTLQQMAPVDTPAIARRFVDHWNPGLAIFAEGDVWPNLLSNLTRKKIPSALINARMTEKSLSGWRRWPATATHVFGQFGAILASDRKTATGLADICHRDIPCSGNLKSALPLPAASKSEIRELREQISERAIVVAASTHETEEALFLDAFLRMKPRPFAIIAPRHPNRAEDIERLLNCSNLSWVSRSRGETPTPETDLLLADTIGEMGLWYRLADFIYLGGGHAAGVGGHNPLEPVRLGKAVVTGPSVFNFEDVMRDLEALGAITSVADALELSAAFPKAPPSGTVIEQLDEDAFGPMERTIDALSPLLDRGAER